MSIVTHAKPVNVWFGWGELGLLTNRTVESRPHWSTLTAVAIVSIHTRSTVLTHYSDTVIDA